MLKLKECPETKCHDNAAPNKGRLVWANNDKKHGMQIERSVSEIENPKTPVHASKPPHPHLSCSLSLLII